MEFDIVGTTGNIYKTTIGKVPFCNCPDGRKGNQCKHICYGTSAPITHPQSLSIPPIAPIFMTIPNKMAGEVLVNVLKAPAHLQYQLALLSSVSCPNKPGPTGYPQNSPQYRNSATSSNTPPSPAKDNPKPTTTRASAGPSKATVRSASWNSSPRRKKSSGAAQHAGIISTKHVSSSGLLRSARRACDAFSGMTPCHRVWK